MRALLLTLVLATCTASPSWARQKPLPLPEATAATLSGKTLAVTRRAEKPSFIAATAGKATFALLGVAAMAAEGNRIVRDNSIADPADTVEAELVPALVKQYGVKLTPASGHAITPGNDLKQIIAAAPGVDWILDIRSVGWNFNYYPTHWGTYWVGYGVQVQLVDAKSGTVVSDMPCGANTQKNASPPSKEALLDNGAQLLKDVLTSGGWTCALLLAKEQFRIAPENLPEMPPSLTDPLAAFAAKHSGTASITAAGTTTPSTPPPASDAPAAPQAAPESAASRAAGADH
jgi:hypothetical protein